MATGKAHAAATKRLAWGLALFVWTVTASAYAGTAVFLGTLSGIYLTPDLDVDGMIYSKHLVASRYRAVGAAWYGFWWLYARALPHRHPVSHWPVIGTLGRLAYAGTAVLLVMLVTGLGETAVSITEQIVNAIIYGAGKYALLGLIAADALHWVMDW